MKSVDSSEILQHGGMVIPVDESVLPRQIRVKFLGNYSTHAWLRQLPGGETVWGGCHFLFDHDAEEYDWLVVYNDMPGAHPDELLRCPRQQTMLVTSEPSNIKSYGMAFSRQFGYVLTSQEPSVLPHGGHIHSQSGLQWYYGIGGSHAMSYDAMVAAPPMEKTKCISTVCSSKRMGHTLHKQRYDFVNRLKDVLPELEIFGHGVRWIDDKAEALDSYRYHIAIENFYGDHHWTEKLADSFLGVTLPFYYGCPNAEEYFPPESFIRIDINDVAGSCEIIRRAIDAGEYERRLPHILEARRLVMEEYNLFAVLSRLIGERTEEGAVAENGARVLSRRLLRRRRPLVALQDFAGKCRMKLLNFSRSLK